ncbi:hypothetical protein B0F90DRAFT_1696588 [Multifurca ochricompacta]|uniref:Uncharacterized protein n=1 Tax=Multifurca ochricompacta TaxID=376703 RepID=A0AAD4M9R6_9AGAM|nr:hypothetical protein B0F90DRAFT_1696588 [Multifurca ochricompacta]
MHRLTQVHCLSQEPSLRHTKHTGALGGGRGVQREGYTPIASGNGGPFKDLKGVKKGKRLLIYWGLKSLG